MKKIIFFVFLATVFSLQSCVEEEKDIFDDSAANRTAKELKEYQALLESASNGWVMTYYYEKDPVIRGGIIRLCAFKDGIITAAAEEKIDIPLSENSTPRTYLPGETATSEYKLIADQGPVLTINTYNDIMHYLALPNQNDVDGLAGDYEFIFMSVENDMIILKGKKYGKRIVMTRMPENITWNDYLAQIEITRTNAEALFAFDMIINNQKVGYAMFDKSSRQLTFEYETGQGTEIITSNLTYNPTGIKLYKPITFGEATVENFALNITDSLYTSTDAGVNMILKKVIPLGFREYNEFLGNYEAQFVNLDQDTVTLDVQITTLLQGYTYTLSGMSSYNYVLGYEGLKGAISLSPQNLSGATGNYSTIDLYPWNGGNGLLPLIDESVTKYLGYANREATLRVITFKMEGSEAGSYPGLILIGTGSGYSPIGGANAGVRSLVLTKKN